MPAGGRKSPSGPEIAFPGCVHAHSGSFGGGHLKYYINWRTKFQRFWLVNFLSRKFFRVRVKNFPPTLTLLVRHHSQNDHDTKSSKMRFALGSLCSNQPICSRLIDLLVW